jgi:D-beta-D-heptose 7-phosphate kinase/D-beta-D-heptose 1-phosphate adenosyltransferase
MPVLNRDSIEKTLESFKGNRIVFTNGCFDLLHVGHIRYLNEAKKLGDLLFVGLNTDASVKRLKGPNRPVQNEKDRAEILSELKAVDFVCLFDEDTPYELIKIVKPHVLVKGGDWPAEKIVGSDLVLNWGGEVKSLNFVPGKSTTALIEKSQMK